MQYSLRYVVLLIVFIFLIGAFFLWAQGMFSQTSETSVIQLKGQEVRVTVVDTPESRAQGLSGRSSLAANEGMLFVFPEDGMYAFWMKDMRFSIDIIWLSSDRAVVDMAENVSPDTFPAAFSPKNPARYVVELPAGFVEEHNVVIGDSVTF